MQENLDGRGQKGGAMGKKDKKFDYFDAFEQQSKLALKAAKLLIEVVKGFSSVDDVRAVLAKAHEIESEGDSVGHDVYTAIARDFITPIEREDIILLTRSLDDIIDYLEDVLQRLYVYNVESMHERAYEFAEIIYRACEQLNGAMADFRNFKKSKKFKSIVIAVNDCEEEGDRLFMFILRDLHTKHRDDPLYVIAWSELFARMERCTDACEHVADTMHSVILKNS